MEGESWKQDFPLNHGNRISPQQHVPSCHQERAIQNGFTPRALGNPGCLGPGSCDDALFLAPLLAPSPSISPAPCHMKWSLVFLVAQPSKVPTDWNIQARCLHGSNSRPPPPPPPPHPMCRGTTTEAREGRGLLGAQGGRRHGPTNPSLSGTPDAPQVSQDSGRNSC